MVRDRLRMQRYSGVPLETRGILASPDPVSGELTIWASGQWPHTARGHHRSHARHGRAAHPMHPARCRRRFRRQVRHLSRGHVLVPLAATRLNRPVKWIEDRREHLLGSIHAREMTFDLELALKADGTILGLRGQIISDQGAYVRTLGNGQCFAGNNRAARTLQNQKLFRRSDLCADEQEPDLDLSRRRRP